MRGLLPLPVVNNANMNTGVQVPTWVPAFHSFGCLPSRGSQDHIVILFLTSSRSLTLRMSDSDCSVLFWRTLGHPMVTKSQFWWKEFSTWYNWNLQQDFLRNPFESQYFLEVFLKHWLVTLAACWITCRALKYTYIWAPLPKVLPIL